MEAVEVLVAIYGVFTLMAECQEVPPAFLAPNAYREDRSTGQQEAPSLSRVATHTTIRDSPLGTPRAWRRLQVRTTSRPRTSCGASWSFSRSSRRSASTFRRDAQPQPFPCLAYTIRKFPAAKPSSRGGLIRCPD